MSNAKILKFSTSIKHTEGRYEVVRAYRCRECRAMVGDVDVHEEWHTRRGEIAPR